MSPAIGLDTRMIENTGIGTYVRGLLRSWAKSGRLRDLDLALFGKKQTNELYEGAQAHFFRSRIYSVQEQFEYPFHLRQCRLWHAPHYNVPVIKTKTKLVVTIHDLIHWIFRKEFFTPLQAFYAKTMFEKAIQRADHIIAVSQKTKNDLIECFDANPERISVIYEGVDDKFHELQDKNPISALRQKYQLPQIYFLYVGSLKPHKNVLWLIHIFRKLKQEQKVDAALVLVGKKDKKYPPAYKDLSALKSEGGIFHIPFIDEKELVTLYNGALGLVHPSLYEGFGLTLLEAMACGTPVIACRSASVPEVTGDAACLVDSCADKDMADAIVRLEKFETIREELKQKGRKRIQQFRWDDAADRTAEIYERVLSGKRKALSGK